LQNPVANDTCNSNGRGGGLNAYFNYYIPQRETQLLARNIRLVFSANALILLCGVFTSLLSAWALGPKGRGELFVVVLWPPVCALFVSLGLSQAHRYWVAKDPECISMLFSNAILFSLVTGLATMGLAEFVVPHLVGNRGPEVMHLVHIYLVNIPAALLQLLMIGMLEGARRFGWGGMARLIFFGVQGFLYLVLWLNGHLTLETATLTMIVSQSSSMLFALIAVWRQLNPTWQPSWKLWKRTFRYGIRDYPGAVADFATLRMDQLLLGGLGSSVAIGLYVVAVRISEITAVLASSVGDAMMPEMAAATQAVKADMLLARSLRLTIYAHLTVLVPLWIAAPHILEFVYGKGFLAASSTLRVLLVASVVLSTGGIIASGLNGFGHPGLSTIARVASAIVTAVALLTLFPRYGIVGVAIASLIGYSVMLLVAFFCLVRRRELGFWSYLRPRWDDLPRVRLKSLLQAPVGETSNLET
jgi:O-antigen/teichoic acid export membrane protein